MPHPERPKRRKPSTATAQKRAARRAELLDAADRVIRRYGPDASMDRIAAEARTAKPVLYRYFGDKGGLYQALAERYVRMLLGALREAWQREKGPRRRFKAAIDAYLRFIEREREAYGFLMKAASERPEAQVTVGDFMRQLGAEIATLLEEELVAAGLDTRSVEPWAQGIVGMVQQAGDWWLRQSQVTRDELSEDLTRLLWRGFAGLEPLDRVDDAAG